jgi:hypothetical protein
MVTLAPPLLLCPSKIFRQGNKITLSLVMVYSALFSNVFKALKLVLYKYVSRNPAAWQWYLAAVYTAKFFTEFWHGYGLAAVISIT